MIICKNSMILHGRMYDMTKMTYHLKHISLSWSSFRKVEKYEEEAGGDEKEGDENDPGWTQVHIDSKLDNGWFIPTSKVTIKFELSNGN